MTTRPLTLTPSQLRAALAGRLEQVRRPVEPQPPEDRVIVTGGDSISWCLLDQTKQLPRSADDWRNVPCPWGVVGGRLTCEAECPQCEGLGYDHPYEPYECDMCKVTGKVGVTFDSIGIRVERLSGMTEVDAYRCGVEIPSHMRFSSGGNPELRNEARCVYANDWDAQHGQRYPWASNPWCWVLDVRKAGE